MLKYNKGGYMGGKNDKGHIMRGAQTSSSTNFTNFEPDVSEINNNLDWNTLGELADTISPQASPVYDQPVDKLNSGIIYSDIFDHNIRHHIAEADDITFNVFGYPLLNYRQEIIGRVTGWLAESDGGFGFISRAKIIEEDGPNINNYAVDIEACIGEGLNFLRNIVQSSRANGYNDKMEFVHLGERERYQRFENSRLTEKFIKLSTRKFVNIFYGRDGQPKRTSFYDGHTTWADPDGGLTKGVPEDFLCTLIDMETPQFTLPTLPPELNEVMRKFRKNTQKFAK